MPKSSPAKVARPAKAISRSRPARAAAAAPPNLEKLYGAHYTERIRKVEAALAASGFDALLITSGTPHTYFADDQDAPHKPTPHFAHWTPLAGPHHLLRLQSGRKPLLVRYAPEDYWYEQAPLGKPFWAHRFEVKEVGDVERAYALCRTEGRVAFLTDNLAGARLRGYAGDAVNPPALLARLDWDRSTKSDYEVVCLTEATRAAARGHAAAKTCFEEGGSEFDIHHAYLAAVGCSESELPYPTIIAHDAKAATLHYTGKRTLRRGKVLLIDAGASYLGYGSDITRTYAGRGAPKLFKELLAGMDALQRELCERVKPGLPYLELHRLAHLGIADLLHKHGVITLSGEAALAEGLTRPFFPHGLGHFLGIQVHDVSGRQQAPAGGTVPPPQEFPYLRTTRVIEVSQVFTIEPGLYFIEMLLRELRSGARKKLVNWQLVDELLPCGGIRIEDNVLVTANGHRNLTRPFVP
jgi:Xaa-Pro dipeptidase